MIAIVIVRKTYCKICLCLDYFSGLKESLDSRQYPLPLPENLFIKLNGGIYFAKQYSFTPTSKWKMMLILRKYNKNTSRVVMSFLSYNHIPIIDAMLTGLTGIGAYIDDIIVMG